MNTSKSTAIWILKYLHEHDLWRGVYICTVAMMRLILTLSHTRDHQHCIITSKSSSEWVTVVWRLGAGLEQQLINSVVNSQRYCCCSLCPLSTIVMGKLFVLLHPDQAGSVSVIKDSVIVMIQETLASWLWSVIPLLKVIILYHFILMDQDITHHHTYNSRSLTTHVSC